MQTEIGQQLEVELKKAFEAFEKLVTNSLSEAGAEYNRGDAGYYRVAFCEVTELMEKYKFTRPLADKYKAKYKLPINYIR